MRIHGPPGLIVEGFLLPQPNSHIVIVYYLSHHLWPPEHVSGAERWEFPLPSYVGVCSFAPSLKVTPDSSAQRPLSAHLKIHSALVKSLHADPNLKEGAIPDVAPIWPVCMLFEIFYKLHLSTNDLWFRLTLEGTRESGLVHALDLWRAVSERNLSETEPSLWPLD